MDIPKAQIKELSENIGLFFAGLGALAIAWRKGVKPIVMKIQYAQEVMSKLDKIMYELVPNGGGSLRDAINRIESRQLMSERRQKAYLLESSLGIWETDEHGRCVWGNRTLERMLGRSPEGYNWLLSIAPAMREEVQDEWQQAVEGQREYCANIEYITPAGHRTKVIAKAYPLVDELGSIKGWYGIASEDHLGTRRED